MQILMDFCPPVRPQESDSFFKLLLLVAAFELDFTLERVQTKTRAILHKRQPDPGGASKQLDAKFFPNVDGPQEQLINLLRLRSKKQHTHS